MWNPEERGGGSATGSVVGRPSLRERGKRRNRRWKIVWLFLIAVWVGAAEAAEAVPEHIRAVLLMKVVPFIKELKGSSQFQLTIGVLEGGTIYKRMTEAAAKSEVKVAVKEVSINNLQDVNILYIPMETPSNLVKQYKETARKAKILTVGGDPNYVLQEGLTLSFHLSGGSPKILVNIGSAEEEGAKFDAKLLKIADLK
jgi:hypothetical protein